MSKSIEKAWSAYSENPQEMSFETQASGEKVILLLRRHFATNIPWIFLVLVLSITPFLVMSIFQIIFPEWMMKEINSWFVWMLWVWYLVLFGFTFTRFLWWYFNIYLLTNERIIDIDFVGLLYKRVSDAHLSKIQDVTYHVGGIVGIFFHYGDVFIQTAAEEREFDFHAVPSPDMVAAQISDQVRKEEAEPPGAIQ